MDLPQEKIDFLDKIYFLKGGPGSFGSTYTLWKAAQKSKSGYISVNDVKKYLKTQKTYTINKKLLRRFPRRKLLSFIPGEYIQIDIIYLAKIKSITKKKRLGQMALTVIDVFSKKAGGALLHDKTAASALKGLQKVLSEWGIMPTLISADRGKEWEGPFKKWCEKQNIHMYSTHTNVHAVLIENFNGQIKRLISKYAMHFNSTKWSDYLAMAIDTYNSNPTKSLPFDLTPNEAFKEDNISRLQTFYFKRRADYAQKIKKKRPIDKYKPGDKIRVLKDPYAFTRGFKPKFSNEIYSVEGLTNTIPYMIRIRDSVHSRSYYPEEVSHVYDTNNELDEPRIIRIKSSRLRDQSTLRSGKSRGPSVTEFLTEIENVSSAKYLTAEELKKYINGQQKLDSFMNKEAK